MESLGPEIPSASEAHPHQQWSGPTCKRDILLELSLSKANRPDGPVLRCPSMTVHRPSAAVRILLDLRALFDALLLSSLETRFCSI